MDWSRLEVNQQTELSSTPVRPRASPRGYRRRQPYVTFGGTPPSTRSITDRTGGYEPPDGEFDSPRVYMNKAGFPGLAQLRMAVARRHYRQWHTTLAPCNISHIEIYNPCLPEEIEGRLTCLTCGLKQRLELAPGAQTKQPTT